MKLTASILLAAAVIAPVVAYGLETEDSLVTREDNEFGSSFARDFDLELEEREFDDNLFEREPRGGFGGHASSQSKPNKRSSDDLERREFDEELFEREPRGGFGGHASSQSRPHRRSSDDLEQREFDEELFEREPRGGFGGHASSQSRPHKRSSDDLEQRDFNELHGRARGFFSSMGRMKPSGRSMRRIMRGSKALGRVVSALTPPETPSETPSETREFNDDLLERDFDEELNGRELTEDLMEREYYDELD